MKINKSYIGLLIILICVGIFFFKRYDFGVSYPEKTLTFNENAIAKVLSEKDIKIPDDIQLKKLISIGNRLLGLDFEKEVIYDIDIKKNTFVKLNLMNIIPTDINVVDKKNISIIDTKNQKLFILDGALNVLSVNNLEKIKLSKELLISHQVIDDYLYYTQMDYYKNKAGLYSIDLKKMETSILLLNHFGELAEQNNQLILSNAFIFGEDNQEVFLKSGNSKIIFFKDDQAKIAYKLPAILSPGKFLFYKNHNITSGIGNRSIVLYNLENNQADVLWELDEDLGYMGSLTILNNNILLNLPEKNYIKILELEL